MNKVKLVAFDVDGVFLENRNSWDTVSSFLGTEKNIQNYQLFISGKITYYEWMYLDTLSWIRGSKKGYVSKEDLERAFQSIKVKVEVVDLAKRLRQSGKKIVLLSGGIDVFVRKVALMIGEDVTWFANILIFDSNGRLVPGGIPLVPAGKKGEILRRIREKLNIIKKETAFIGDSAWDKEGFTESGLSILYNGIKEELSEMKVCAVAENVEEVEKIINLYEAGEILCEDF
jgi:phosphoserine phosphatase